MTFIPDVLSRENTIRMVLSLFSLSKTHMFLHGTVFDNSLPSRSIRAGPGADAEDGGTATRRICDDPATRLDGRIADARDRPAGRAAIAGRSAAATTAERELPGKWRLRSEWIEFAPGNGARAGHQRGRSASFGERLAPALLRRPPRASASAPPPGAGRLASGLTARMAFESPARPPRAGSGAPCAPAKRGVDPLRRFAAAARSGRHSAARIGRSGWARRCAFRRSATMNAISIDCSALSRGSQ